MQKIALSISITLLSIALVFIGVVMISPQTIQNLTGKTEPTEEENSPLIFDDSFDSEYRASENQGSDATVKSAWTEEKTFKKQYKPLPTPTKPPSGIPEDGWGNEAPTQAVQSQKTNNPWEGYANKEAFCKDIASQVMMTPAPAIDQSNLPPELRVTENYEAAWRVSYQSCMDQIRDY